MIPLMFWPDLIRDPDSAGRLELPMDHAVTDITIIGPGAIGGMVATKAYDSNGAAEWFTTTVHDQTRVAVLQNGVDHIDRMSEWLPRERILPVIVDCPTERSAPGKIRQRGACRGRPAKPGYR